MRTNVWVAALGVWVAPLVSAQVDNVWVAVEGGQWSDPANWSLQVVPNGPTASARIDAQGIEGQSYTVDLDISVTLASLALVSPDAVLFGGGTSGMDVSDNVLFRDAVLDGLSTFVSRGSLQFDSDICDDLCDTPLLLESGEGRWTGGDIRLLQNAELSVGQDASFRIENASTLVSDAGSRFINEGQLVRDADGVTTIDGGQFVNIGSLRVESGTLRTENNAVDLSQTNGRLQGGSWSVAAGAEIDLVGQSVISLAAEVRLEGDARFDAVTGSLGQIESAGVLELGGGASLITAGDLFNAGRLTIEQGSRLEVDGKSTLLNDDGGTLGGGMFEIAGVLAYLGASIERINNTVALDGVDADIQDFSGQTAFDGALAVSDGAIFSVQGGKDLTTAGDLAVEGSGRLIVGAGSAVRVASGFDLTSFDQGAFVDGTFDVRGTLQFDGAAIDTVGNNVTIDGAGSQILDGDGNDAFGALSSIGEQGRLGILGGRELNTTGGLAIDGDLLVSGSGSLLSAQGDIDLRGSLRLDNQGQVAFTGELNVDGGELRGSGLINGDVVGGGTIGPGNSPGRLTIGGAFTATEATVVEIELGGTGVGRFDQIVVLGDLVFVNRSDDGDDPIAVESAGVVRVSLLGGYRPSVGDVFDVMLFASAAGTFDRVVSPGFEAEYLSDRLRLTYVPAPAGVIAGMLVLPLAARRRR